MLQQVSSLGMLLMSFWFRSIIKCVAIHVRTLKTTIASFAAHCLGFRCLEYRASVTTDDASRFNPSQLSIDKQVPADFS